jgi:hypothetical protein
LPSNRERGQQLLQLSILIFKLPEFTGITHIHATKPRFPFEKRRLANRVLAALVGAICAKTEDREFVWK